MGRNSLQPLKKYLEETVPRQPRVRPGDPAPEGPLPPIPGLNEPNPTESRKELISRLRTFYYPYVPGNSQNKKRKTFYGHMQSSRLLYVLLKDKFIWHVRMVWFFQACYRSEKYLKDHWKSYAKYHLDFHGEMMRQIFTHRQTIEDLLSKYSVPQTWAANYLSAARDQLHQEARYYYPGYPQSFTRPQQITPHSFAVDMQIETYSALVEAFSAAGIVNSGLACQLTALICSLPDEINVGELYPTPEHVRQYVKQRRNKIKTDKINK